MTAQQGQGLFDVIEYATHVNKTVLKDEHTEVMRFFVSAINCKLDTARDEMLITKNRYSKTGGIVAYHGYQSFAPGEATPEIAHEIGIKLAERLWGNKYEVVVATHLDKKNHLHNHFVVNSVSVVDGVRYHRTKQDYYNMQRESDALCREYGLSVIEEPQRGAAKHYAEWNAERGGHPTWRGMVKADVDTAIRQSMTERQFFDNLRKMGYEIKPGKDISVRPPGKERFVRLFRNFGGDYAIEGIRRRILAQIRPERQIIPPNAPPKKVRLVGTIHKTKRMTGLRALYFYYIYRMGVLPKKREPNPKQVYFLFREDIRFIQNISRETRLLVTHKIDTADQLSAHKDGLAAQMNELIDTRKQLRNRTRSIRDEDALVSVRAEIAALSDKIGELRREVRLCEDIDKRSAEMRDKFHKAAENGIDRNESKSKEKELTKHDQFR
jgi:hypothetical protein